MLTRNIPVFSGLLLWLSAGHVAGYPDPGRFTLTLNSTRNYDAVVKNIYNGTRIFIRIRCDPLNSPGTHHVKIGWVLRETQCWTEYAMMDIQKAAPVYYKTPEMEFSDKSTQDQANFVRMDELDYDCSSIIVLDELKSNLPSISPKEDNQGEKVKRDALMPAKFGPSVQAKPQYVVDHDGDYMLIVHMEGSPDKTFRADVDVAMVADHGYLSIVDWPLLPFYGFMCMFYVCMGLGWLVVCSIHWKDLLRIQFWIGAVILLGMLEKAMFYAEFQSINSTGLPVRGLMIAAEIVSCAKRSLARMLVIIVSLGFGIVKPRLGPTLHRIVGIGGVYFIVASTEAVMRVVKPKNDLSSVTMMAGIPLAVIDSSICWWVFSALVQTTRTLRLRRNLVKLSVYRHFTNTLLLAVIASVVFMLWSIKYHKLNECLQDWKDLWMDEALWHLLFSFILLVIMVLWTPSKNNQRYAFTPLLDYDEDAIESDEDDGLLTDAYEGMKLRSTGKKDGNGHVSRTDEIDDPLKWVEENIPEAKNALPIIDSDEEIETTKFEISKLQ